MDNKLQFSFLFAYLLLYISEHTDNSVFARYMYHDMTLLSN